MGIMVVELEKETKMGGMVWRMSSSIWDQLGEGGSKTYWDFKAADD